MTSSLIASEVRHQLNQLDSSTPQYATKFVDALLDAARSVCASDVHAHPTGRGLDIRWRLDGVLQKVGQFPSGEAADIVARLKVLADLLTYRNDVPQEGRLKVQADGVEMRLSTFPTLHGERAVVRLFAAESHYLYPKDLRFPAEIEKSFLQLIQETSGLLLITGPAGSGKTTTAYAGLREMVRSSEGGKSILSLEDPIEVAVEGVAQAKVNPAAGFDLAAGIRSLMRQDPEIILVGEIRDRATAETAFGASLTGHLVITTFHAGSSAEAIGRLSDMGIEPYLLRSGLLAILNQRLVRTLCQCSTETTDTGSLLGLSVSQARLPVGCPDCHETGYRGRTVLAEMLLSRPNEIGRAILSRSDSAQLEALAVESGMTPLWSRALSAVEEGLTSPAEVRRVFGFADSSRGNH